MPFDGALYWYGWKDSSISAYGKVYAGSNSPGTATYYTNYVQLYTPTGYSGVVLATSKAASEFANYTKLRASGRFMTSSASYPKTVYIGSVNSLSSSYTMTGTANTSTASTSLVGFTLNGNKGSGYQAIEAYNGNTSHHLITVQVDTLFLE